MSTHNPQDYQEGSWAIRGQQLIMTHTQGQWILQPMDIEHFQIQRDPAGGTAQLWIKARAMAQPHLVGQFPEGVWNLLGAMSAYATRNGIPVYHNLGAASAARPQQTYPTQPQAYPAQQQTYPAQQQAYPAQQQAYPAQPQAYPAQPQAYPGQQQAYPMQQQAYPPQQQPDPARQQAYPAQQPYVRQPQRPGGRPAQGRKKKGNPAIFFLGLFLIFIAIAVAGSSASGSGAVPLIIVGIILLVASSGSGKSRGGRSAGTYRQNGPNTWNDDYANSSGGFIDRDHDGIDDRYDSCIDSDNDGIPDSMDSDSGGDDGDSGGGSDD